MTLICWLALFLSFVAVLDGTPTLEELERRLETLHGIEKARALNELATAYWDSDSNRSLAFWRQARELATTLDGPDELFTALKGIGAWHHINTQYREAITYYLKALELESHLKNKQGIPDVLSNIGIVYWNLGDFPLSQQYHTRALALREKLGYTSAQMAHTLNNLGLALQGKGEHQEALEYFHQALALQEQAGNRRGAAAALNNISNSYKELKVYPTALKYLQQSIDLYKESGYQWGVANSTMGVGRLYTLMGQYDRALPYLECALEKARQINAEDVLRDSYQDLSRVYEARQDFKKAAYYYEQFSQLKRKILEHNNRQYVSVLGVKYEIENKEQELQLLRKTRQRETLVRFFLAAAVLLFLALILVLHLYYITDKRLNRQLGLSEAKYRSLFDQAGDAILLMDGAVCRDCNQKTLELFEGTRDGIIGKTFADFSPPTQPDGRDSLAAGMEYLALAQAGTPRQFQWRHRKKDGSLSDTEVNLSVVTIDNKQMIQVVAHDISLTKRLEDERVKSAQLETLGLVAGGIAHDFNSVLAAIKDNLGMVKRQNFPGATPNIYVSEVEKAILATEQLVEKFFTISEGGFLPMETLYIGGLIRESALSRLKEPGVSVASRFIIPVNLWPVDCDKIQIHRLIGIVVQNALDAMNTGGEIEIAAANVANLENDEKQYVQISICDNGEGIRPEHLPKIFDPYFSTRDQVTRKGLGMGLTVARAIVKRHHGVIDITSEPGKGTSCRIYLPANGKIFPVEEVRR